MTDTIEQAIERLTFRLKRASEDELGLATVAEADLRALLASHDRLRIALGIVLPMAKGYAAEHPVGSNAEYVLQADAAFTAGKTK